MRANRIKRPKRPRTKKPNRYRGATARRKPGKSWIKGSIAAVWSMTKMVFGGALALTILMALSIGLILGYQYLIHSPYFMVRKVVIEGIDRVSRQQVLSETGLDKPTNMLTLRLEEMGMNLRNASWVDEATLTRKLPDTIYISINERTPKALISLGALYYLDRKGKPFKKVDPKENPEMPIITGFTWDDIVKRERFTRKDLNSVFTLMGVLKERNDSFRLDNISEINFDPARGLSLFTRDDNVQVRIGFKNYRAKLTRLGRVIALLKIRGESDNLVYFNLVSSPRVIVRRAS